MISVHHFPLLCLASIILLIISCTENEDDRPVRLRSITYGQPLGLGTYEALYDGELLTQLKSDHRGESINFGYREDGTLLRKEVFRGESTQPQFRVDYEVNTVGDIRQKTSSRLIDGELQEVSVDTYDYIGRRVSEVIFTNPDRTTVRLRMNILWDDQNPIVIQWFGQGTQTDFTLDIEYDISRTNKLHREISYLNEYYPAEILYLFWQSIAPYSPVSSVQRFDDGSEVSDTYLQQLREDGLPSAIYRNDELWMSYEYDE